VRVIAGSARGTLLKNRKGRDTRPTSDKVKGALFNILGPVAGTYFLDLFAGSGAIGIEALSRGARGAVFVEKDGPALRDLQGNLLRTGLADQARILASDVSRALGLLGREGPAFDYIFLDPPYRSNLVDPVLREIGEQGILQAGGMVIVEHEAGGPLAEGAFYLRRQRVYGDTALSFFEAREREEGKIGQ
jgi:16S rRNA (guanine966-N2)-methyltransferase